MKQISKFAWAQAMDQIDGKMLTEYYSGPEEAKKDKTKKHFRLQWIAAAVIIVLVIPAAMLSVIMMQREKGNSGIEPSVVTFTPAAEERTKKKETGDYAWLGGENLIMPDVSITGADRLYCERIELLETGEQTFMRFGERGRYYSVNETLRCLTETDTVCRIPYYSPAIADSGYIYFYTVSNKYCKVDGEMICAGGIWREDPMTGETQIVLSLGDESKENIVIDGESLYCSEPYYGIMSLCLSDGEFWFTAREGRMKETSYALYRVREDGTVSSVSLPNGGRVLEGTSEGIWVLCGTKLYLISRDMETMTMICEKTIAAKYDRENQRMIVVTFDDEYGYDDSARSVCCYDLKNGKRTASRPLSAHGYILPKNAYLETPVIFYGKIVVADSNRNTVGLYDPMNGEYTSLYTYADAADDDIMTPFLAAVSDQKLWIGIPMNEKDMHYCILLCKDPASGVSEYFFDSDGLHGYPDLDSALQNAQRMQGLPGLSVTFPEELRQITVVGVTSNRNGTEMILETDDSDVTECYIHTGNGLGSELKKELDQIFKKYGERNSYTVGETERFENVTEILINDGTVWGELCYANRIDNEGQPASEPTYTADSYHLRVVLGDNAVLYMTCKKLPIQR